MSTDSELTGIIYVVAIIAVLIQLWFFIKIWAMTNDTRRIKELLEEWLDLEHPEIEEDQKLEKK